MFKIKQTLLASPSLPTSIKNIALSLGLSLNLRSETAPAQLPRWRKCNCWYRSHDLYHYPRVSRRKSMHDGTRIARVKFTRWRKCVLLVPASASVLLE